MSFLAREARRSERGVLCTAAVIHTILRRVANLGFPCLSSNKEIPNQVKENRRSETQRINTVENAAVALDDRAEILHANVALDRAHHQATGETEQGNHERHSRGLERREWRCPPERRTERCRRKYAPEETLPGLVRADLWRDLVSPREFSRYV